MNLTGIAGKIQVIREFSEGDAAVMAENNHTKIKVGIIGATGYAGAELGFCRGIRRRR